MLLNYRRSRLEVFARDAGFWSACPVHGWGRRPSWRAALSTNRRSQSRRPAISPQGW